MRELREFRAHHSEFAANNVAVAGVTRDTVESNHHWVERLRLLYPLLSDRDSVAGDAFGVTRRIGIGEWKIEFFRRSTFLIDARGVIAMAWENVKVRGHAPEVLEAVRALPKVGV